MPASPNEQKHLNRAVQLNKNLLDATPIEPPATPQSSLNDLIDDQNGQWSFSTDGSSGAILIKSNTESTGGAAVKIEDPVGIKKATKVGQMMENFFQNAQGNAPFVAPRITSYSQQELVGEGGIKQKMVGKLDSLKQGIEQNDNLTEAQKNDRKMALGKREQALGDIEQGKASVLKMEFASGQLINKLPIDDRVALYKSDAFAQSLGRSAPTMMMLGLTDHLGVTDTAFKNNASNLMIDTATGQLSVIDFDTGLALDGQDPNNDDKIRFAASQSDDSIKKLETFLKQATESEENFNQALDGLANGYDNALKDMMESFGSPTWRDNMFTEKDKQVAENEISEDDRKRFAANLMSGLIDGLDYAKKNQQALRLAVASTHEQVGNKKVEHFYTDQQLDDMCNALDGIDVDSLKQNMGQRMEGMENQRKQSAQVRLTEINEQAGLITEQSKAIQTKIDKLSSNKLKALYNKKEISSLKEQKAQLQAQGKELSQEANNIMNRESSFDYMKKQAGGNNVQQQQNQNQNLNVPDLNQPQNEVKDNAVELQPEELDLDDLMSQEEKQEINELQELNLDELKNGEMEMDQQNLSMPDSNINIAPKSNAPLVDEVQPLQRKNSNNSVASKLGLHHVGEEHSNVGHKQGGQSVGDEIGHPHLEQGHGQGQNQSVDPSELSVKDRMKLFNQGTNKTNVGGGAGKINKHF